MATPNVRTKVTENGSNQAVALALNVAASEVTILAGSTTALVDPSGQTGGYGGQLLSMTFINSNTTTARRVKAYLIASGDGVADDVKILDETIPADGILLWQPNVPAKYKAGAVVKAMQTTGTDVYAKAEAVEFY